MANDSGTFKYWRTGSPAGTVEVAANSGGSFKYWLAGSPAARVYPAAAAGGGVFTPPIHNINQAVNRAATY